MRPARPRCERRARRPPSPWRKTDLVTLSFWLPPPEAPRRFATWFFLAPADDHPPVVVDDHEIHEHRWQTPAAAMAVAQPR